MASVPGIGIRRAESGPLRKNAAMHLFMMALWLSTVAWFNPRLMSLGSEAHSFAGFLTLALFIVCLNIFWMFGSYYVAVFLFSFFSQTPSVRSPPRPPSHAEVAVLYLTRNDFKYEAALSCVRLRYDRFHVFILDDSTEPDRISEVDAFHRAYPRITTVIRREGRRGFKAGSLNNALRNHAIAFPYFAVIDADGVTPPDFLAKLMPHFSTDKTIGFVQGAQRPNPRQKSKFASDLAPGILPLWTTYYPPRNKHGFVLFLGHGGIVRRDVWEAVGGFPEIAAEDLGFSTKAREHGYQGLFVDDVHSLEDFPETYRQLRGQQERYVKGGCEFLGTGLLRSFLRSSTPAWFEKLDLVLWISTLFLPILYLVFLVVYAVLMPLSYAQPRTLEISFFGLDLGLWGVFPLSDRVQSVWGWDFFAVTVINVFAPVLGSLRQAAIHPARTLKLLVVSCVPYLSLSVLSVIAVLTYATKRHVEWDVTGESPKAVARRTEGSRPSHGGAGIGHASPTLLALELGLGAVLTVTLLMTFNAALMVYPLSLLLGPALHRFQWRATVLTAAVATPYVLLILAMGSVGASLWGMQGISYALFPFHL